MTTVAAIDNDPATLTVDALVVGLYQADGDEGPRLAGGAETVDAAFSGRLAATFALLGATGAVGEVTKLASLGAVPAPVVAAVGLGEREKCAADTLRRAAGAAARALAGNDTIAISLPLADAEGHQEPADAVAALAEGALLGGYQFGGYKTKAEPGRRSPATSVSVVVADGADQDTKAQLKRAATLTAAVAQARDWVNTAPNQLRPPQFADAVADAVRKAKLEVEVLDEKALRKGGYGGILAVGEGSGALPRLVRIAYRPKGAAGHVALVGKGITFDTGGVSIKPAQGMWEMKSDMAGAAAVAAAMLAVAALKPKVSVTACLPMAENMLSGNAYRPGDIVTMYNGKRVEVLNTDAEGRMILGDAIARACEDEPDYLLETSTLTGGQVTALGKRVAGVMGSEELCDRVKLAGEKVGEPAWPMPLPEDVRKNMESDIADLSQVASGLDRAGHMLQGAVFLSEFVSEGVAWAHIDIAGPSYHPGEPYGYVAKGGTGVPVRTLVELIEDIAANG
ncbi:MAG: leucyl aminopeptidase [Micromonosporaceae bacterium]|nr:leucyl aminopeptidase [Micromonosporaceae bacterium]